MIVAGQSAPAFEALDQDGATVSLAAYLKHKNVVLYFYPKDDTSGCTLEAQQFTALVAEFDAADTVVIGVSKDSCESHRAFIGKYALSVKLLADVTGDLCQSYGVWQEKEKNGIKKMGIVRSTFLIDKQGVVRDALYQVSADGHAAEVLGKIRAWNH